MPVIMEGDRDEVGPSTAPALSSQQQALGTANSPIMLIPAGSLVSSLWPSPSSKTASTSTAVADASAAPLRIHLYQKDGDFSPEPIGSLAAITGQSLEPKDDGEVTADSKVDSEGGMDGTGNRIWSRQ